MATLRSPVGARHSRQYNTLAASLRVPSIPTSMATAAEPPHRLRGSIALVAASVLLSKHCTWLTLYNSVGVRCTEAHSLLVSRRGCYLPVLPLQFQPLALNVVWHSASVDVGSHVPSRGECKSFTL